MTGQKTRSKLRGKRFAVWQAVDPGTGFWFAVSLPHSIEQDNSNIFKINRAVDVDPTASTVLFDGKQAGLPRFGVAVKLKQQSRQR